MLCVACGIRLSVYKSDAGGFITLLLWMNASPAAMHEIEKRVSHGHADFGWR
jgi:hypothetical protein